MRGVKEMKEKFWIFLAWHMPKVLVYWASVRLMSSATTGEYSSRVVPGMPAIEALQRWK